LVEASGFTKEKQKEFEAMMSSFKKESDDVDELAEAAEDLSLDSGHGSEEKEDDDGTDEDSAESSEEFDQYEEGDTASVFTTRTSSTFHRGNHRGRRKKADSTRKTMPNINKGRQRNKALEVKGGSFF
jgi:hypothetical protein